MRKLNTFFLAAILCFSLAACGGNNDALSSAALDVETSAPAESNSFENDASNEETPVTTYDAEEIKEEADALWQTFLETVAPIETDSQYASILKIVNDTAVFNSTYYEKATGNSKDEYLELSTYEQFLWYSTYILPVNAITASDYDTYCGSVTKWNSYSVGIPYNWFNTYGTSEMAAAYRALMEWDYYYFLDNGAVYNFITGGSSLENTNLDILSPDSANGNDGEPTDEEIQSLIDEENKSADTHTNNPKD